MRITLVPTAGLCNRMNAILCAIASYEQYKIPIKIYWEKTIDCYAEFSDLFEPLNHPEIKVLPLKDFYLKPGGKKLLFLPNLLRNFIYDAAYKGNEISNFKLNELCENKSHIYIQAYNRFCSIAPVSTPIIKYFQPTKSINSHINSIIEQYYTHNTIGIHIRRTDNIAAIRNNPIEKFITYMNKELYENPETNFYLATDSEEIKKIIIDKFDNKIIPTQFTLNRNSLQGMKDAVTELFCLGKTKRIIGSSNSTYSQLAARLFNIELII